MPDAPDVPRCPHGARNDLPGYVPECCVHERIAAALVDAIRAQSAGEATR